MPALASMGGGVGAGADTQSLALAIRAIPLSRYPAIALDQVQPGTHERLLWRQTALGEHNASAVPAAEPNRRTTKDGRR